MCAFVPAVRQKNSDVFIPTRTCEQINKVSNAILKNGIIIRRPPPFQPTPVPSSASLPVLLAPRPQDSPTSATQSPSRDGDSAQRPSHARSVSVCTCYCKNICNTPTTHLCFCLPACLPAGTTLQTPAALVWRGGGRRGEEERGGCGGAGGGEEEGGCGGAGGGEE